MAYQAILDFEGNNFDVIRCTCSIERQYDLKGRPSSNLFGGKVTLQVESTGNTTIFDYMANQFKPNSGTITYKKDEADTMKEISWENGYIIDYNEKMTTDGTPMTVSFTVSVQKLIIGKASLEQNWPEIN